jgi:osmoprotectant transport system substrate-binding protein
MFARKYRTAVAAVAAGLLSALTLAACGSPGSSGTEAPPTNAASAGPGCEPMASDQLILLADDRKLQKTDNVIAAINGSASSPALKSAVDKVADSLDQPKLLALNKAVEIDRKSSAEAATAFASANNVTAGLSGGSGRVVVGAANFPESLTLAELYKLALNAAGFQATVQQSTNREVYEPALERGEITVFPEYAATLTEFLNKKANGESAPEKASTDVNATVAALTTLGQQYGLTFGKPSTASDQNAFATTKPVADKYNLKTLSDFAAKCSGPASVLAGPPECPARPFCQAGLKDTYGIIFGSFLQADAGGSQTKTALKTGKATLGLVFSSDSSLTAA